MPEKAYYKGVFPIGDTDPKNLPVPDLESAIPFYETALGFAVRSRGEALYPSAVLARDDVEIVLAENGGDPGQASCYFSVSDVEVAFQELFEKGIDLSPMRIDQHDGKTYRVFFVRAPDGLCYCLGQQV